MGFTNAPALFSRFMDTCLASLKWNCCLVYMDDILVFTAGSFDDHLRDTAKVFTQMASFGLKMKPAKVSFCSKSVHFLGHIISEDGIRADPEKLRPIKDMPLPKDRNEMRAMLGTFGYYRKWIKGYAEIAEPLNALLRPSVRIPVNKDRSVKYTADQLKAIATLKTELTKEGGLFLAHPEWDKPFEIHCDASTGGLGATLVQMTDAGERVVCYASKSLNDAQKKYPAHELEMMALDWAIQHFKAYIYGRHFTVRTDSRALAWLLKREDASSPRVARYAMRLQEHSFDVVHKPGKQIWEMLTACHATP